MKYWRGYLTAGILAAFTWALTQFAAGHRTLVDMVYPYVTRLIQSTLADWTAGVDFCLWQLLAVLLVVIVLASIAVMVILKWNPIQWLGWVLAGISFLWMIHTGIYGLNNYAGPLSGDIRLNVIGWIDTELVEATTYFRDQVNALSVQIPRDEKGSAEYPSFEDLADMAAEGFDNLVYDKSYSVFAGSTAPVKKLGWADMYSSMGIAGLTMSLTGEAAVNPNLPDVSLPFTMCHEMAHRMCIASERDANMAAFLATTAHNEPVYQYSGYFMAFRYCYNVLATRGTSTANKAAREIFAGLNDSVKRDLADYGAYLDDTQQEAATNLATSVNDSYIKASGDKQGVQSYNDVVDLLVSWHVQEIYLPQHKDEEVGFNPMDKNQVELEDVSGGK